MPEKNYGKRLCLLCEKEFEARHPAHVTCSAACARERRLILRRESDKRGRAKRKKYLLDLLAELDTAYSEMEWANCRCEQNYKALHHAIEGLTVKHACEVEKIKAELKQAREERDACRTAVEKQDARPKEVSGQKAPESAQLTLQECPRMHLRATLLPCGQREECFTPLCEKLGGTPQSKPVLGERICPVCKKPFMPKSAAQKYCNNDCRVAGKKRA